MSELRINWKNLLLVVPLKNGSFLDRDYLYKYGDINDIYKKSFFSQNIYIKKFFYNNSNRNDIDTTKLYNAADLEEILWNIGNIEISFKTLKKITGKGSILTSCIKRMIIIDSIITGLKRFGFYVNAEPINFLHNNIPFKRKYYISDIPCNSDKSINLDEDTLKYVINNFKKNLSIKYEKIQKKVNTNTNTNTNSSNTNDSNNKNNKLNEINNNSMIKLFAVCIRMLKDNNIRMNIKEEIKKKCSDDEINFAIQVLKETLSKEDSKKEEVVSVNKNSFIKRFFNLFTRN